MSIIRARLARRPASYSRISWPVWAGACLLLTAAAMIFLDGAAADWRAQLPAGFVATARTFTDFGLGGWYLIPPAVLLLLANLLDWRTLSKRWHMVACNWTCLAFFMLGAAGLSGLAVTVLKHVIGRQRPNLAGVELLSLHPFAFEARFASFPSGHATNVGAVAAMVMLLSPSWGKYVVLPVTVWIAVTRVVVGMHYPSDTIAGFGLGVACTVATALIFARLGFIFRRTAAGLPVRKKTFRLRATWRKRASPPPIRFLETANP
ncbi:phosphatase PAP2 family protein [Mesorhizobium sp. M00.F.Ca.ET.216.01.1.1]|nr:phosphatase PAP2 family protein [Mesorhizobium sp. M00.F.Ca.ET.216.01.1.1]